MIKKFNISVEKLTNESLMRRACEMTFLGNSKQSLSSIYKSEHSPVRTQLFWVEFKSIPLFVSTHILRHHVGSVPYQLTCREDRKGGNVSFAEKLDDILDDAKDLFERGDCMSISEGGEVIDVISNKIEHLKNNADRQTPVNLGLMVNAQSLIDMSKMRLCLQAHKTTVAVFKELREVIREVDPALADMMVVKCVYRNGLCGEPKCCGYNKTKSFAVELAHYQTHFH